jgi:hypothetical protein
MDFTTYENRYRTITDINYTQMHASGNVFTPTEPTHFCLRSGHLSDKVEPAVCA